MKLSTRSLATSLFVIAVPFGTLWLLAQAINYMVLRHCTTPITNKDYAAWVPVVNPIASADGGVGYVPGLYRADFEDGLSCVVSYGAGLFNDDQLSCVRMNGD